MYTSPVATTTLIKKATFTNYSGSTVTVTAYIIASAGTAGNSNIVLSAVPIAAGNTYEAYAMENVVLSSGDFVQCLCNTATSANFSMSGVQILNN
jgi:hypothetical protein